jgi:spore maturation protein CgeB
MGSLEGMQTPRLSLEEVRAVFAYSKISFCLTKMQFSDVLHERIFTVLACHGFPLCDFRRSIDEAFPKNSIATYHSFDDAKEKIKYFLKHDSERIQMAAKAREWAFEHHSIQSRALKILEIAQRDFGIL